MANETLVGQYGQDLAGEIQVCTANDISLQSTVQGWLRSAESDKEQSTAVVANQISIRIPNVIVG